MSRFSSVALDLSRFPPPLAIRGIDYEGILAQRKARFIDLMRAKGVDYSVGDLVSDTAVELQETDAGREMLALIRVNDAVRSVMVAFATGADLDHLAAFYGITRRVITPASGTAAAVLESDAEFRRRVLLAPEAFAAAGPPGAFIYHALSADPRVLNVDVWSPEPGDVAIAIQSREADGLASPDLIEVVRATINRPNIKPLTDVVMIRSVTNHGYNVDLDAYILRGPDPWAVHGLIEDSILATAASRRAPARNMPRSALTAAAQLSMVDRVLLGAPGADIAMGYGEVPVINGLNVRVHTND